MNNAVVFTAFLRDGIGLSQARQRTAITTHGFDTCQAFIDTSENGIKDVFSTISKENRNINNAGSRVYIRENIKQRFYGAREEFLMRIKCGSHIDQPY